MFRGPASAATNVNPHNEPSKHSHLFSFFLYNVFSYMQSIIISVYVFFSVTFIVVVPYHMRFALFRFYTRSLCPLVRAFCCTTFHSILLVVSHAHQMHEYSLTHKHTWRAALFIYSLCPWQTMWFFLPYRSIAFWGGEVGERLGSRMWKCNFVPAVLRLFAFVCSSLCVCMLCAVRGFNIVSVWQ